MPNKSVFLNALYFTLAMLAVFGLHELGHKFITMFRGVEASMPYFIPAPPGTGIGGTFGAVIVQKEPPVNRDALFDLGLSGPLVGFFTTVIVSVIGLKLSFVVPLEEVTSWMITYPRALQTTSIPLIINLLSLVVKPVPDSVNYRLILHPVGFAAWVGALVTFINLIPAWQLDGGHISRAILGRSYHKIASIIGIIVLLLTGYYVMAAMIVFFMMRSDDRAEAPLDDISPLSQSRKALVLVYFALIALNLVVIIPL
jgi:membrane-associated protease RseP (regulator of RpoE activity)